MEDSDDIPSLLPPQPLGGVVHTYLGYDAVKFGTSQPADASGAARGAFEHLLGHGSMRHFTDEELANAITQVLTNSELVIKMIEEGFKFEESISTFSPEDAVEDHKKMLGYLKVMLEGKHDQKFVVVGHHAPTKLSTHPRYANELIMNGGYSSDLSEFILDHPQIKLWTHGHTHEEFDYLIGTTRIVCNPRGYINYEDRADNFKLKFVEV